MKLKRGDQVIATDMDGETVMMDIESGSYFALTGSGSHIWASLEKPATLGEITERVREEFDVSGFDNVEDVIAEFVEELFNKELVTAVN